MAKAQMQPDQEAERLAALRALCILDTPPEPVFDLLTALTADLCNAPIALISLVDEARLWFKSTHGIEAYEAARDKAFCSHAILQDQTMVVEDATKDPRFADSPLVTGALGIRSYTGAPLITSDGHRVGTLCVINDKVTLLAKPQIAALEKLAAIIVAQIESRRRLMEAEAERLLVQEKADDLMYARSTLEKQASQLAELAEERERLYQSIAHYQRFVDALLATVPIPIFARDMQSRLTHVNQAYAEFFGIDAEEVTGKHVSDVYPPRVVEAMLAADQELLDLDEDHQVVEGWVEATADQPAREFIVHKAKLKTPEGKLDGIVGAMIDVTEERALRAHLEELATTDPLTGAGNRRAFMQHAEDEISRNRRYGHRLTMVLLDLDLFKSVNDTYGHQAGDAVLKGLTKVCMGTLRRPMDFLARLGGEEFAVLAVDTDIAGAASLAERMRRLIAEHCTVWAGEKIFLTASFGVASVPHTMEQSLEEAMRRADKSLYAAKSSGRNCVWVWDDETQEPVAANR